jgi:hypothetical protein
MSRISLLQTSSVYPNPGLATGLDVTKIDYSNAPPESLAVQRNYDGSVISIDYYSSFSTNASEYSGEQAQTDVPDDSIDKYLRLMTLDAARPGGLKLECGEMRVATHLPKQKQLLVIEKVMPGVTGVEREQLELAQDVLLQQLGHAPAVNLNGERDYDKEIREAFMKKVSGGVIRVDIMKRVWTAQAELPSVHQDKLDRLCKAIYEVKPPDLSKLDYRGLFLFMHNKRVESYCSPTRLLFSEQ